MKKIEELFKIIEQSEDNSEYHDAIFELIDNYQDTGLVHKKRDFKKVLTFVLLTKKYTL